MKTLFVLRHAKSSWDNPNLADFERPLNERGLKAAALIGEMILKKDFKIGYILSSPANRAKQTANLVKEYGKLESWIKLEDRIYEANTSTLENLIAGLDEEFQTAMLVGHNPGLEGFIGFLTGELCAMPTAALAVIDLEIEHWNQISHNVGSLRELLRSRDAVKI